MQKFLITFMIVAFLAGSSTVVWASDWDKAGKAFAIIEGVRVLTGGKVDVIGSITGINREPQQVSVYRYKSSRGRPYGHRNKKYKNKHQYTCFERVWVPHYIWKTEYVPRHEEFTKHGKVIVEAHHVRYQEEHGGHWETRHYCDG